MIARHPDEPPETTRNAERHARPPREAGQAGIVRPPASPRILHPSPLGSACRPPCAPAAAAPSAIPGPARHPPPTAIPYPTATPAPNVTPAKAGVHEVTQPSFPVCAPLAEISREPLFFAASDLRGCGRRCAIVRGVEETVAGQSHFLLYSRFRGGDDTGHDGSSRAPTRPLSSFPRKRESRRRWTLPVIPAHAPRPDRPPPLSSFPRKRESRRRRTPPVISAQAARPDAAARGRERGATGGCPWRESGPPLSRG